MLLKIRGMCFWGTFENPTQLNVTLEPEFLQIQDLKFHIVLMLQKQKRHLREFRKKVKFVGMTLPKTQ